MGRNTFAFNIAIFFPAVLLSTLGLITLLSLDRSYFLQQLVMFIIGLFLFWVFSKIDFNIYQYINKYIYIGCIFFLLITFLGPNIRGATRWLEFGIFRLQPSELIKPFLIIVLANLLAKQQKLKIKSFIKISILILIPILLVFKQPDLGNSIIYGATTILMILVGGIPVLYLFLGTLAFIIVTPLIYFFLHDYQKLRLIMFINPNLDPRGAGYNAIQSMIAVGSGQIFGRGFGRGTQSLLNFLPEHYTDFIFASHTEEFGLIGAVFLLGLYLFFLWQILNYAKSQILNNRVYIFTVGIFVQLFIQVVINIGMNIGLLPITGITLPFVSLGGSSLIAAWIGLGMLSASTKVNEF